MGDKVLAEELRGQLKKMLPSFWDKAGTEPGRIFQKNNPWLDEVFA
jgi:hypothetical protein